MTTEYDIFQPAKPMKGAIVRDWTGQTLTIDVQNALGERYHFEVPPSEKVENLPPRYGDTGWHGKCQLDMIIPIKAV